MRFATTAARCLRAMILPPDNRQLERDNRIRLPTLTSGRVPGRNSRKVVTPDSIRWNKREAGNVESAREKWPRRNGSVVFPSILESNPSASNSGVFALTQLGASPRHLCICAVIPLQRPPETCYKANVRCHRASAYKLRTVGICTLSAPVKSLT